jgi:hypothetical protein
MEMSETELGQGEMKGISFFIAEKGIVFGCCLEAVFMNRPE